MVQYSFSLENFEIFILILVRVSCFVYIAPFYGMSNVPNQQVKIGTFCDDRTSGVWVCRCFTG